MEAFVDKPYISCIRFDGRPILPPIVTPSIFKEMTRFKRLAVDVEKRIDIRRQIRIEKSTPPNDEQSAVIPDSVANSPPDMISAPPSVASTYLARYMRMETDLEGLRTSSASMGVNYDAYSQSESKSTLVDHDLEDNSIVASAAPNASEKYQEQLSDQESDSSNCVHARARKLSYTLDQPSPALVAQLKYLKVSMTAEPVTAEDDCSHDSIKLAELDSGSGSYCTAAGTSTNSENVVVKRTREEHLQRYLQQVSHHSVDEVLDSCAAGKFSNGNISNVQHDFMRHENEINSALNNSADTSDIYDQMLIDKEMHFESLRIEMENQHKKQMEQLKRQREKEFEIFRNQMISKNKRESEEIGSTSFDDNHSESDQSIFPLSPDRLQSSSELSTHRFQTEYFKCSEVGLSGTNVSRISDMKPYFDKVSAAVKGYLVRRLFRTEKVQNIIKTIKDTLEFALQLHSETPIKQGRVTPEYAMLNERILAQLSNACFEFHEIFITLPVKERMAIIAQDRALLQEKYLQEIGNYSSQRPESEKSEKPRLSSATLKALERRRHRTQESSSSSRISHLRGRIHSPRSGLSSKHCRKFAIESGQVRSVSPALIQPREQHKERSRPLSENMDKSNLRSVRRCLYGKHQAGKSRTKSTVPPKSHSSYNKK